MIRRTLAAILAIALLLGGGGVAALAAGNTPAPNPNAPGWTGYPLPTPPNDAGTGIGIVFSAAQTVYLDWQDEMCGKGAKAVAKDSAPFFIGLGTILADSLATGGFAGVAYTAYQIGAWAPSEIRSSDIQAGLTAFNALRRYWIENVAPSAGLGSFPPTDQWQIFSPAQWSNKSGTGFLDWLQRESQTVSINTTLGIPRAGDQSLPAGTSDALEHWESMAEILNHGSIDYAYPNTYALSDMSPKQIELFAYGSEYNYIESNFGAWAKSEGLNASALGNYMLRQAQQGSFFIPDNPMALALDPCGQSSATGRTAQETQSHDPNAIVAAPAGAGAANYILGSQRVTYTVTFQNAPSASAAAQNVRVVVPLDPGLDPGTVAAGTSSFPGALFAFDPASDTVTWLLPGVDLPPDTNPPSGEGWVSFSASPKAGLATGTPIREAAQVFFDYNPPVVTSPVVRTIDATPPAVTLQAPPATVPAGPLTLAWSAQSAAGVASYTVYLSVDGGPLLPAGTTAATSETLQLQAGQSYGVAVQATDVAGLSSPAPAAPQAAVRVAGGAGVTAPAALPSRSLPAATTVASSGGTLTSLDGSFTMTVPAGAIAPGQSLSVTTSATPPAGAPPLPAMTAAASPYVTLSGASLSQPAVASLRYTAPAGQPVMVYADGAWRYLPTAAGATARFYVAGPGTYVALASSARFPDVPPGYWARASIATLAAAGIASGFPDGTFQPGATLTRADLVKMLDLVLGLRPASAKTAFTDVPAGAWYEPYVAAAAQAGLVDGTSPTTFSPGATLTREQLAVVLVRALTLSGGKALAFRDAAGIDPYARGAVAAAVQAGYLNGFPDGTFRPQAATTRAQAAKVLARVIAALAPAP